MPEPPPGFMEAQSAKFAEVRPVWEAEYAQWKSKNDELRRAASAEGRDPKEVEIPAPAVPVPEADLSWMPEICFELLDEDFGTVLKENYARGQPLRPMLRRGEALHRFGGLRISYMTL